MYSYAGQHEDELAFNVGDIITLISKEEEAWWKGELDGNQGVFPSNYVEELNCKYILKRTEVRGDNIHGTKYLQDAVFHQK